MNALQVEALRVDIGPEPHCVRAVRDVSFTLQRRRMLGIVGESGSGKSMAALSILGLLPPGSRMRAKTMRIGETDLMRLSKRALADLRGRRVAMIFQDPMTSLNPVFTIGNQLEEAYLCHLGGPRRTATQRAVYLLERVGVARAADRLGQYPHEMSGGLRQRVMIAMALMCDPEFLIADEPTTALDVTTQLQVLKLLRELQDEFSLGVLLITHDLGVVAQTADDVAVMHAGRFVETGPVREVFKNAAHAYTKALLAAVPVIGGNPRSGDPGAAFPAPDDIDEDSALEEASPGHHVRRPKSAAARAASEAAIAGAAA